MRVHTFPGCCGAGILIFDHLTGLGKESDFEAIKKWIYFAKRNGFRMYDHPGEYDSKVRGITSVSNPEIGQKTLVSRNGWGMLTAITAPHQKEIEERLKEFGEYLGDKKHTFKPLLITESPFYGGNHPITLWGLDIFQIPEKLLLPKEIKAAKVISK